MYQLIPSKSQSVRN